jgi:hypothetical protein
MAAPVLQRFYSYRSQSIDFGSQPLFKTNSLHKEASRRSGLNDLMRMTMTMTQSNRWSLCHLSQVFSLYQHRRLRNVRPSRKTSQGHGAFHWMPLLRAAMRTTCTSSLLSRQLRLHRELKLIKGVQNSKL